MGDVTKGRNPAAERKEAAAAEWAKRMRGRLTLGVLIQHGCISPTGRPRYAAEAVRALRHALAKHLNDRLRTSTALPWFMPWIHSAELPSLAEPAAAYGRACFAWAMKRGTVTSNPFAELPMPNSITRRERVLTDEEAAAIWRAAGEAPLPYGTIVRLLMLTGQRREEVALPWAELSGAESSERKPSWRGRAEQKRAALDAWSAHLLAAAEGGLPAGKVLPFSRAGSGEMYRDG